MPVYRVLTKSGEEVIRYCAANVREEINGIFYPFDEFDHIEVVDEEPMLDRPEDWRISIGSFFDRFGALKLPILASPDPMVQALVKDVTVRKYIDLKGRRNDLVQALELLQMKGFDVDPAVIIDTKPTEEEVFRG